MEVCVAFILTVSPPEPSLMRSLYPGLWAQRSSGQALDPADVETLDGITGSPKTPHEQSHSPAPHQPAPDCEVPEKEPCTGLSLPGSRRFVTTASISSQIPRPSYILPGSKVTLEPSSHHPYAAAHEFETFLNVFYSCDYLLL